MRVCPSLAVSMAVLLLAACGNNGTHPGTDGGGGHDAGGVSDAGQSDGGAIDAGPGDAGAGDAGFGDAGTPDAGSGDGGTTDGGTTTGCHATLPPADAARRVVVGFPYDANMNQVGHYEVWSLAMDGSLTRTGETFDLGYTTSWGHVVFTPDGNVALVAQNDGSIGVVRFDPSGPVVVDPGWKGGPYATGIVMEPGGDTALVIEPDWPNAGGGIYRIAIACDGSPSLVGQVLSTKNASEFVPIPGRADRALVVAVAMTGSGPNDDADLVSWPSSPARVAGVDAFADNNASPSAAAVTPDGRWAFITDDNTTASYANRVAVVGINGDTLTPAQILSPIDDPADLAVSPDGKTVIVLAAHGNAIDVISWDGTNAAQPWVLSGPPSYVGGAPQLPQTVVEVTRGPLAGRVLVGDNVDIRMLDFVTGGGVVDRGPVSTGSGFNSIVGAIGVSP